MESRRLGLVGFVGFVGFVGLEWWFCVGVAPSASGSRATGLSRGSVTAGVGHSSLRSP